MAIAIECDGLTRRYGDLAAVDGVSFEVHEGERFALLGPNGAGKTTTLHMLITMLPPSAGQARILGHDVVTAAAAVRERIGVIFQEPALDDRLSAWENLHMHAVFYGLPKGRTRQAIAEALEWAALTDAAHRLVRTYSGGMKRRLELARALMHRPRVLFLDEPTVGLDPQARRHLWEAIARLQGLTVFMTTHYLEEAEHCDRVAIMDHGKLIACGSPQALKASVGEKGVASLEDVFLHLTGRQLRDEAATPRARLLNFARRGGENTR